MADTSDANRTGEPSRTNGADPTESSVGLVRTLRERAGCPVRVVASGGPTKDDHEVHYRRDNVPDPCPEVFRDLVYESVYADGQERIEDAGAQEAVVRLFEEALVVVTFHPPGRRGTYVALDPDADVDPLEVVEVCRRAGPP